MKSHRRDAFATPVVWQCLIGLMLLLIGELAMAQVSAKTALAQHTPKAVLNNTVELVGRYAPEQMVRVRLRPHTPHAAERGAVSARTPDAGLAAVPQIPDRGRMERPLCSFSAGRASRRGLGAEPGPDGGTAIPPHAGRDVEARSQPSKSPRYHHQQLPGGQHRLSSPTIGTPRFRPT